MLPPTADYFDYDETAPVVNISDLQLGVRARHTLRKLGCQTAADASQLTEFDLIPVKGCGVSTAAEIRKALNDKGIGSSISEIFYKHYSTR